VKWITQASKIKKGHDRRHALILVRAKTREEIPAV